MVTARRFATEHAFTTDRDISSELFWAQSFEKRDETFGWLRRNAPVSWHPPLEDPSYPPAEHGEAGFWAVTRLDDIRAVSQQNDRFSSAGIDAVSLRPCHPSLSQTPTFLEMDPPQQARYRRILSSAFTPKGVARVAHKIEERAVEIVDAVVGAGNIDFVEQVSCKLPMLTIADMIGIPESETEQFARSADMTIGAFDPEVLPAGQMPIDLVLEHAEVVKQIGLDVVRSRRSRPRDDLATALAQARPDGERLSDDEIGSIFLLLAVAGNDTTKQTTSSTVIALARQPDQRRWLMEDFEARIGPAIEEFLRHGSPVIQFSRVAAEDIELNGQRITSGDKVAVFYCSGNRDEAVFVAPHRFDLERPPVPHVAFGGGGVHFCLGNGIAKAQLRALFRQILQKLPGLELAGEPAYLFSEFIHGVRRLPVRTG